MARIHPSWKDQWIKLLNQHSYDEAVSFLNVQAGDHRGTPNAKLKSEAISFIKETEQPQRVYEIACAFTSHPHATAKEIATYLLVTVYDQYPTEVMRMLFQLADDVDWEVREWAASACGERLTNDFDGFYPEMVKWVGADSANVRRAAALAAKYACKAKRVDWAQPLLELVEPLLMDPDPYVKKNLGPFTIGDAMLRTFPKETMEYLEKWMANEDIHLRWNVAKVFTTAEGAKNAHKAIPLLENLLNDHRIDVKRAVKSAMANLKKRVPEVYNQLLKETSV